MKVVNYSTVESEIHLTKYRKKGFLRLVFSRLVWILFLLFLQLYLFYGIFSWMKGFYRHYSYVMVVFRIIMTLFLFNNDMESSAKLTWLIIISIAPVPGSLFLACGCAIYLFFRSKTLNIYMWCSQMGLSDYVDYIRLQVLNWNIPQFVKFSLWYLFI